MIDELAKKSLPGGACRVVALRADLSIVHGLPVLSTTTTGDAARTFTVGSPFESLPSP